MSPVATSSAYEDAGYRNQDDEEKYISGFSVSKARLLKKPHYSDVNAVIRTVHYREFLEVAKTQAFEGSKITSKYKTALPKRGQFVFFRATREKDSMKNDFYGNVGLSIDILQLLKADPTINMFHVDCAYFVCSTASRILLTRKKSFEGCPKLDLNRLEEGMPIILRDGVLAAADRHTHRKRNRNGKRLRKNYRHSVEFVFDLETIDTTWIYNQCKVFAVDHYMANLLDADDCFGRHQCLIYNTRNKTCPSPWTREVTENKLVNHQKILEINFVKTESE